MQKDEKNHQQIHPVAAALTGVVIGASAVTVGVVALRDEKNRQKVKKAIDTVKDQAAEYMDTVQERMKTAKKIIEPKLITKGAKTVGAHRAKISKKG